MRCMLQTRSCCFKPETRPDLSAISDPAARLLLVLLLLPLRASSPPCLDRGYWTMLCQTRIIGNQPSINCFCFLSFPFVHIYICRRRLFSTTISTRQSYVYCRGYLCSGVIPCSLSRLGFPAPATKRRTSHTSPFKAAACTSILRLAGNSSQSQHRSPDIADRVGRRRFFFSVYGIHALSNNA